VTKVELAHPERYWLAVRADMPGLQDPDLEDQHQRWPDRDGRDWAASAAAVQHVMDEVAGGRGRVEQVDEEDPDAGEHVVVDLDLDHLDAADEEIVSHWFWEGLGPVGDPWRDRVENGRHRLWNSWEAAPDAVLPVYSATLSGLDSIPYEGDHFATIVSREAMEGIELIPPTVLKRNPSFYAELRRVASLGEHDDVMPCRRWSEGHHDVHDAVRDNPDLLPHLLAGVPVRRHEPVAPPEHYDVVPAHAPTPWWRRVLTWLSGTR
jgi:hypothetical protein